MTRWAPALGWTAIAAAALGMLLWGFGTWPHPFVDFGRELYVPWRLGEGDVLYRDLAWFNGPFSPYWNAGVFGLLGTSLMGLVAANLAATALLVWVLHALLLRVGDRLSATAACGVFVTLFAFSQFDPIGNDNYLTPYSHEVTHGLLLSLLAIYVYAWKGREQPGGRFAVGLLLGLVALTKAEIFLAALAAVLVALGLDARARRGPGPDAPPRPRFVGLQTAFWTGLLLPPVLAFGLLAQAMPAAQALHGTLGAWPALLEGEVAFGPFYQAIRGTLGLAANLYSMGIWSALWLLALLVPLAAAFGVRRPQEPASSDGALASASPSRPLLAAATFVLSFALVYFGGRAAQLGWPDALRPLPLLMGALALLGAWKQLRAGEQDRNQEGDPTLQVALWVFAGLLLAKVGLRVRLDQYGFALAMPATLLGVVALLHGLPRQVVARGGEAGLARAGVLGVLLALLLSLLPISAAHFALRDQPLGHDGDAFLTDLRAPILQSALAVVNERPAGDTLAVLPEGVMLNYLARRENPTGHINFMPPELTIFGEEEILAAFRAAPPTLIALVHKDTREYGVGFFGQGYGTKLYGWVRRNYRPLALFGAPPLRDGNRFGIQLLEHREPSRAR